MNRVPVRAGLACFLLGALLAVGAGMAQRRANDEQLARRLEVLSRHVTDSVATRMRSFEFGLRGLRGVVVAEGGLPTADQVRRYADSRDIDVEFPGARGFGLIWRVPASEEAAFVARMAAAGRPDFAVRQIVPHDRERFVITYIEPQARNGAAVGLDVASEPRRREAALAAQASGQAAITEPITLVQASGRKLRSFLVMLPVTRASLQQAGTTGGVVGWSYAPVVIDEVLATLPLHGDMVWLELRDAGSASDAVFYQSAGAEPDEAGLPALDIPIMMFNREWVARLRARPALAQDLNLTSPRLVGSVGLLVAALLGGVAFLLAQRRQRARTSRMERAERAAIVEASDDGIVAVRLDGTITEWNGGAQRLFGFAASEVLGRPIADVLPGPGWLDEDAAILASARAGRRLAPFETQRRHRGGAVIDVSVSAAPIHDAGGRLVGLATTFRDIRAAKTAQRELEGLNATLDSQVRERTAELDRALRDLRNIVDALPSMIGYWDRDLSNRMANRAYANLFGLEPVQMKCRRLGELPALDSEESCRHHVDAALRGEARTFQRVLQRTADGPALHVLAHYLPDLVDGVVQGFYVLMHDVSELEEQRTALEAEKREKAGLLATIDAHAIVSTTDRNGVIISVNERFSQISGYAADELIGHTHRMINSGTHPPAFWQAVWRTVAAGGVWQGEICNRAKDGSLYWVDSIIAPFLDQRGRIEKIVSLRSDITARKRAEIELRQTLATLESVLRSATQVAIVATDRAGMVTLFNPGAEGMLGYDASEIVGRVKADSWVQCGDAPPRVTAPGESYDCHYRRKDGGMVPVTVSVAPILDDDGVLLGHIQIAHDIRTRLRQEALLKQAAAAARDANEAKTSFLANMSHEIRTPLNAVIGLGHLLERTTLDHEQAQHVADIRAAGRALLAIVDDVLDLSKIEAGEMAIERVAFSLRDLCSDLHSLFASQARDKGLTLRLSPDAALPDVLLGDPVRVRQILVNLLGNAIKFTERGRVELAIGRVDSAGAGYRLLFSVSDTGIGIDAAALERLFLPFAQADASTSRRFGGTGLGLSIVKHLAEMMGGNIAAHSALGEGSLFEVELPFGIGDAKALAPPLERGGQRERLAGLSVLLVDDSEMNLTVAGRLLELEGARVIQAGNGAEAVRIACARDDLQLVLMDIQMPVMDGLQAAREILRQRGGDAPLLAALTAGSTEAERRLAREAGFVDIFSKPIDPDRLVQGIRRLLALGPSLPALAAPDTGWPVIAGIDAAQAGERFVGDTAIFRKMLVRTLALCDEAVDMGAAPGSTALARLLHTLKGNAATLAAAHLAAAAERAEVACLNGTPADTAAALAHLARETRRLGAAAAAFIAQPDPVQREASPEPCSLDAFVEALRAHDLSALGLLQPLGPALGTLLGSETAGLLAAHVQALRFPEAMAVLEKAGVGGGRRG